ncbi:MAG: 50S ribosomal protein L15 [Candidatus Azosocius agrarius]|nr:MAG: 50S ribosomal protein L15 [Gammaproteobacteria bacterium]
MYLNKIGCLVKKKIKKRLGRGIGSGKGKTCGRGHKGQKARAGGFHKRGFEGGQSPFQRRVPKFGFKTRKSLFFKEIRLFEIEKVKEENVTLNSLKKFNVINENIKRVKIVLSGKINKKMNVIGLSVTNGVKKFIEDVGGKVF